MTSSPVRLRALVVAIVLVAVVLAVVPAALAGESPVIAAMRRSLEAKSLQWSMDSTTTVGKDVVRMRGVGAQEGVELTMRMTVVGGGKTIPMDARMLREAGHTVMYMSSPALEGQLPKGKTWVRIDMDRAGSSVGLDLSAILDTSRSLEPVLAGLVSSRRVGTDTVLGRRMARYHLVVDVEKAGRAVPAYGAQLEALRKATGISLTTLDYDMWLDAKGRFRQVRFTMPSVASGGLTADVDMTMTVVAYDVPVDVSAPPRRLVYEPPATS